jgi:hypothetical protein
MTPVEEALQEGYTQEEINAYLADRTAQAKAEGYSDEEVQHYIKEYVTHQPDFNKTPVAAQGHRTLAARQAPTNFLEAVQTGWDWSSLGLGMEALKRDGKLPSMAVDSETPWYLRAAANVAGLAGDVPAMIAGGVIGGGPASPITAVGGGFGLPMGLRKVFADALENNEIGSKKEFADRVTGTLWETAKGWITGAATAGAGKAVTGAVSGMPGAAKTVLPTAAELGTLTTVSAALEGHAPEPQALLDNAVVLGVAKAVLPKWNHAKPLTDIYVKTGKHPEQVTNDALSDSAIWQDILDGRTPSAYKEEVQQSGSAQTQAQRAPKTQAQPAAPKVEVMEPAKQAKPVYEMSMEELDAAYNAAKTREDNLVSDAFGTDATEVNKAIRVLETSSDDARLKVAEDRLIGFMEKHGISQKEADRIFYGIGETETPSQTYRDFYREVSGIDIDSPQALGASLRRAITDVGEKTDPAEMTGTEQIAYAKIRAAMEHARSQGWDLNEVSQAAIKSAAGRFSEPSDAAFMLQRFIKKPKAGTREHVALEGRKPTDRVVRDDAPTGPQFAPNRPGARQPLTPEQEAQARAFMEQPFAEIPQAANEPSRPNHINYNRIQTTDEAKAALAQLSTIYESKIKEKRQSPRSWQKSHEDAGKVLADLLDAEPKQVMAFLEGAEAGPSTTAQLLARKELALGFTEDLMRSRAALMAKGEQATPEELAGFLAQVERVSNVHASFLGQRADVGRALNALKSTQRQAERSQAIIDAVNQYGGEKNVAKLVEMLGEYDNPAQTIKFAREATKATTWDKLVEAWKSGLVSGLRTNEVNFLSTAAFTTLRLPTESIAAALGVVRRGEDKVAISEIPARAMGMLAGVRDGIKVAASVLRTGDNITGPKTDTHEPKIPGKLGEVVRLPFRFLSASDMLFKTINERGELYALATKQALREGKHLGQPSFYGRVAELAANPPEAILEKAKDAALRYTFNKPLGQGGQAFARTVREWHLEWLFPFVTTPGNIFKETARMTPGLNFAVKEWRQAYEQGGAARDKALAEVAVGTALMSAVMAAVQDGTITGNGTPDKKVRATQHAAGWKPYAVKVNGQYVDGYLRMAPIGPLIGIAADSAEFFDYMSDGERDQWARMLAFAFASNVTNQTFMSGLTNFVNVLQDPARYGENYFESLAGSLVPGILGQTAMEMDPLLREVHGMRDAMIARVPLQREGLLPKRDLFGQPIPNPERLWWGSPFSVTPLSTDKVRLEAARIGFASPSIPKKIDVLPGVNAGGVDMVELTPAQKDVFASTSGQFAYQILNGMVNSEGWDAQPDIIKRQLFEKAFKHSRDYASKQALLGLDPTMQTDAVQEFQRQLDQ